MSKRQKRRNRHQLKRSLRELDSIAQKQIHNNYNLYADSWGGNRCPGCGISVRPHQLINLGYSHTLVDKDGKWAGHIGGFDLPCDRVKRCPGERDWM